MKKRLFVFCMAGLSMFPPAYWAQVRADDPAVDKQHTKNPAEQTQPQSKNLPTVAPTAAPDQSPESPRKDSITKANSNNKDQQYNPYSDRLYRWYLFATVIGVAVGLLGLIFLIMQTWATRQAAEAALKNATALINTERAWVIAAPVDNAPVVGFIPESGSNLELHLAGCNQTNSFSCSFKSTGNTPARLVEVAIRYMKANKLEDIPKEPTYGDRTVLNNLALVTGDSIRFAAFLEPDIVLKKADHDAVYKQQAFLYAFGIIVYRDVFASLHETRFGYIYHFPQGGDPRENGFRREGLPSSYNQAT
jgi:hypothetical protein